MDLKFWSALSGKITSGEDVVIATIIASKGSVPRGSGARMLVGKAGRIIGTVGGGAVEYECMSIAEEMIASRKNECRHFILDKNDIADIGMVCGGDVDILFQFVSSEDEKLCGLFRKLGECAVKKIPCYLAYIIREINSLETFLIYEEEGTLMICGFADKVHDDSAAELLKKAVDGYSFNKPCLTETTLAGTKVKLYIEQIVSPERVFIFGGGHVAQQLVPILSRCDFNCSVIEDRPEYAKSSLFEDKCDIILVEEGTLSKNLPEITENDYVCIMTRGHKDDYLVQAAVLKSKAHYIGVIGSRRKIAAVNEKLMADGFTKEDIKRITTPIGLDIMSETPAEIAVSICAQLIMVRAKRKGKKQ